MRTVVQAALRAAAASTALLVPAMRWPLSEVVGFTMWSLGALAWISLMCCGPYWWGRRSGSTIEPATR